MTRRPRYQIFIGYDTKLVDGQARYYFEDTDPGSGTGVTEGVNYGKAFLFKGRNFVFKLKPHDAIEYCIELNAIEQSPIAPISK